MGFWGKRRDNGSKAAIRSKEDTYVTTSILLVRVLIGEEIATM